MKVLVADDDRVVATALSGVLTGWGYDVVVANDGLEAWKKIVDEQPSLAIVDWMMPGLDGTELCRRIRQDPRLAILHVILLTGRTEKADLVVGLEAGADDYMVKPFQIDEMRARVQVGVRVVRLQEQLAAEVERLQAAKAELQRLANTDPLTALCNRRAWFDRGAAELDRARRYQRPLSVLMADLDRFKALNDTFGHAAGDEVLQRFASLLKSQCRNSDVVGRVGGEEFAVLLPETDAESALMLAERIVSTCRDARVDAAGQHLRVTCSIGVATAEHADESIDDTLQRADAALYQAKRAGRDRAIVMTAAAPATVTRIATGARHCP